MRSCSSASSVVLDNGSPWTQGVMDHSTTPILSSAEPRRETDHPRRLFRGNRFQQAAWPLKRLADRIVAQRALTWSAGRGAGGVRAPRVVARGHAEPVRAG